MSGRGFGRPVRWAPLRRRVAHVGHLARRFVGSLSAEPPSAGDEVWAETFLIQAEVLLWRCLTNADRRHAVTVAHRFETSLGGAVARPAMAGALLHDVGKVKSGLGPFDRVVATLLGTRLSRGRYAAYHQHEAIGAELCGAAGSDPLTIALVRGVGAPEVLRAALHAADDV